MDVYEMPDPRFATSDQERGQFARLFRAYVLGQHSDNPALYEDALGELTLRLNELSTKPGLFARAMLWNMHEVLDASGDESKRVVLRAALTRLIPVCQGLLAQLDQPQFAALRGGDHFEDRDLIEAGQDVATVLLYLGSDHADPQEPGPVKVGTVPDPVDDPSAPCLCGEMTTSDCKSGHCVLK